MLLSNDHVSIEIAEYLREKELLKVHTNHIRGFKPVLCMLQAAFNQSATV